MLTLWTRIVPALFIFLTTESIGSLLEPCGYINPESPLVQLGSNFTATCVLNEKCLDQYFVNASKIFWKTNHAIVPKEQYTVINRTACSVTFPSISSLSTQLTCNIYAFEQIEQNIYGITITAGLPPEKPKNLTCVVNDEKNMICHWDPGRKTYLQTNYTLKSEWATEKFADCVAKQDTPNSCTLANAPVYFVNIEIWVEAENAFGSVSSDHLNFDPVDKGPSKEPSFWYKIDSSHTHGYRSVELLWKILPPSEANGKILDYEVTLTRWKSHFQNYRVNDTKLMVNLTNDRYIATLTARNLVGRSDASVLTIPGCNFQAPQPVKDLKAFPRDNKLWVEWTAPNESVNKYIVEWCVLSDKSPCIPDWQQEDRTAHLTYLKGNLKESKCYLITVTPIYSDGPGSLQSVKAYLKQAAPSTGPTVRTKKVGKNEAVLEWDHLPVDVQNGFIRNYTIFYKTALGNETAVHVDSSHTEYTLSSLTSDTLYMVRMAAYTDEGGKSGPDFTFTTPKFAQGEIEAIVVPVCLAFLLTTLLGVLFCFNKRDLIKKHIWPNVPDPSKSHIAQWSPHTPPRHNFNPKDHMYPDGNFTDVSVVEIEANVKKPFPEDLKSLDLFKKEKISTEGHSSGIGGSSCMSSSRPSISSSDENESGQNTSSTVQYSTVVHSGYRHQVPSVQVFSRSESTQPLLDSEERPEDLQLVDNVDGGESILSRQQYFKQNCSQQETSQDSSHFERSKQVSSVNEEDFARLTQQQIAELTPQSGGSGQLKMFQEVSTADVFGPGIEREVERIESVGMDEGMPKSYLPQTVRQGGYVPQ
ncbi:PREDICTED: interleukin-6 receptor subunit beta [Elephantulus edwardii]|uniref:interleukin-6 receptor subunit beta n=1 Tax=Elephantulus edwardii TaxID=28737 RepID=UPI0003F05AA9|nr:PREDICTED: interleukin-6 receptor subunit beta [Elephantulus edwardii]